MALTVKTEALTVTRERRTRNIMIDTPEGGFSVSLQRQEVVRDTSGKVIGRGDFQTLFFGAERMNTPERLKLVQAIANMCDEIDQEIAGERAAEEAAAKAERDAIKTETTKETP